MHLSLSLMSGSAAAMSGGGGGGGGGEAIDTDNELMSLIALNRPYIVLLDPASVSSDSATRLMAHVYAGDE